MARFASVNELSPAGTVLAPGTTYSNAVKTEGANDARVYAKVTAIDMASTLDIYVQISPDLTTWFDIAQFAAIVGVVGNFPLALDEEKIGMYTRLKYIVTAGAGATLGSKIEKKQGV